MVAPPLVIGTTLHSLLGHTLIPRAPMMPPMFLMGTHIGQVILSRVVPVRARAQSRLVALVSIFCMIRFLKAFPQHLGHRSQVPNPPTGRTWQLTSSMSLALQQLLIPQLTL